MDRPSLKDFASGSKKLDGRSNEPVTEDQAALQFADLSADQLRYCHDTGAWFQWNGSLRRENRTGLAFHWARELARDLAAREDDKVRFIASKVSFASGVEKFARHDPRLSVTNEVWDRGPYLLGTPEGVVDLKIGDIRPARPEDFITKTTAVAPAQDADCPLWRRFLKEATNGDEGLMRFMQQWPATP